MILCNGSMKTMTKGLLACMIIMEGEGMEISHCGLELGNNSASSIAITIFISDIVNKQRLR